MSIDIERMLAEAEMYPPSSTAPDASPPSAFPGLPAAPPQPAAVVRDSRLEEECARLRAELADETGRVRRVLSELEEERTKELLSENRTLRQQLAAMKREMEEMTFDVESLTERGAPTKEEPPSKYSGSAHEARKALTEERARLQSKINKLTKSKRELEAKVVKLERLSARAERKATSGVIAEYNAKEAELSKLKKKVATEAARVENERRMWQGVVDTLRGENGQLMARTQALQYETEALRALLAKFNIAIPSDLGLPPTSPAPPLPRMHASPHVPGPALHPPPGAMPAGAVYAPPPATFAPPEGSDPTLTSMAAAFHAMGGAPPPPGSSAAGMPPATMSLADLAAAPAAAPSVLPSSAAMPSSVGLPPTSAASPAAASSSADFMERMQREMEDMHGMAYGSGPMPLATSFPRLAVDGERLFVGSASPAAAGMHGAVASGVGGGAGGGGGAAGSVPLSDYIGSASR
eukprot:PLAT13224.1.p1 GENE.PLAT13224.1~~PLAT13224.1.p1  ORF type:complete len:466 (-),score=186.51 PLAT13224.1:114-1511(-)